jgi:type IV secretion system protein VirD4
MSAIASLPFSMWPTGRKLAAGVFVVACLFVLACAAIYGAGVVFLLLNKANPAQARFGSIAFYWRLYSDEPVLRKELVGSMVASGVVWLVLLPAAMFIAARPRRPLHGDARFASATEVARAGLLGGQRSRGPSILVGRCRGRFLALPGQLSVMLSAPTRSRGLLAFGTRLPKARLRLACGR